MPTDIESTLLRRYVLIAAIAALIISPLLGAAYFQTASGADEMGEAVFTGWADTLGSTARPLLDFAATDTVYSVYTLLLALAFPAVLLGARAVRATRPEDQTKPEKLGWRIALAGYGLFATGLLLVSVSLLIAGTESSATNLVFLALMIPGLLVSLIGSTILGVALLRSSFRPRITAWILTLAIPLWIVGSAVLGHNSLGVVPLFFAWVLTVARKEPSPAFVI